MMTRMILCRPSDAERGMESGVRGMAAASFYFYHTHTGGGKEAEIIGRSWSRVKRVPRSEREAE